MARRFTRLELEAIIDMASIAGAGLEGEGDYQTWERRNYRAASTAAQKAHALIHRLDERREARRKAKAAAPAPTVGPGEVPLSCGHPMIDANAGACGVRGCVNEHQAE